MARTYPQRLPEPLYRFVKEKASVNGTKMSFELSNMFNKYKDMETTLNKLEGKNVIVVKKGWGLFK
jgi:hypothetical protein